MPSSERSELTVDMCRPDHCGQRPNQSCDHIFSDASGFQFPASPACCTDRSKGPDGARTIKCVVSTASCFDNRIVEPDFCTEMVNVRANRRPKDDDIVCGSYRLTDIGPGRQIE